MSVSGTIESLTIAGLQLDVIGEAALKIPVGDYEKEAIATSGQPIIKFKKKVKVIEGAEVRATPLIAEQLQAISDRKIPYDTIIVLVDGSIYQGQSYVDTKESDTMDGKIEITCIPAEGAGWTQINKT